MRRRDFAAAALAAAASLAPRNPARAFTDPTMPHAVASMAMLLYPGMTALDLVGPQVLLAGLTGERLYLVAKTPGPVACDSGISLVATHDFTTCPREVRVLLVPGGDGTPEQMRDAETLRFLRERAERAEWITSVCTGSLILGAAGLLDGYRATSHWCLRESVLPLLGAIPVAERVVFDRNSVTAAGVSAGLDFALALAAKLRDDHYAETAQFVAEYASQPPFSAGTLEGAGPGVLRSALAILAPLMERAKIAAEEAAKNPSRAR